MDLRANKLPAHCTINLINDVHGQRTSSSSACCTVTSRAVMWFVDPAGSPSLFSDTRSNLPASSSEDDTKRENGEGAASDFKVGIARTGQCAQALR